MYTIFKNFIKKSLFIWYRIIQIKDKISIRGIIKLIIITGLLIWYFKTAYSIANGLANYMLFAPCLIKLRRQEYYKYYEDNYKPIIYNGKMTKFKKLVLISIDYLAILINFLKRILRNAFGVVLTILYCMSFAIGGLVIMIYIYDFIFNYFYSPTDILQSIVPTFVCLANIKQNNLTLKALQEKLDKLEKGNKANSTNNKNDQNKDSEITPGKENIIVRIRKGGFPHMFIISALLTYANKIPFVNKLTGYIAKKYAKTTWLLVLIKLRKAFIIFNAIIGVITVFKVTGYSSDNMIAGLYGLGYTYVEMFSSFVRRLFNFIFEFFDHKVVPNFPENPPSIKGKIKSKDGLAKIADLASKQEYESLRATYLDATPSSNSWSWGTWLLYGTLAIVGIGIIYAGITLYQDPSYIKKFIGLEGLDIKGKGKGPAGPSDPSGPSGPPADTPDITITDARTGPAEGVSSAIGRIGNGLMAFNRSVTKALNPFNYLPSNNHNGMSQGEFAKLQSDHHTALKNLYPFTLNNPYDSIWKKLRLSILGESPIEEGIRMAEINNYHNNVNKILGAPGIKIDTVSPVGINSVTSMGIPVGTPTQSVYDLNHASRMGSRVGSGWQTPVNPSGFASPSVTSSSLAQLPLPDQADVAAWSDNTIDVADRASTSVVNNENLKAINNLLEPTAVDQFKKAAATLRDNSNEAGPSTSNTVIDGINTGKLLEIIEADKAAAKAAAEQSKAAAIAAAEQLEAAAKAKEFATLLNPNDPNDYTLVRRYIDRAITDAIQENDSAQNVPNAIISKLRHMNPEWIPKAFPESSSSIMTLSRLAENDMRSFFGNVSPYMNMDLNKKDLVNRAQNLVGNLLKEKEEASNRIFILKAIDPKIIELAWSHVPNMTAEKILSEPAKYLPKHMKDYFTIVPESENISPVEKIAEDIQT